MKFMNKNDKSESRQGRQGCPLYATFSAAWGRVAGMAILALATVSSPAIDRPLLNGEAVPTKFSADLQQRVATSEMVDVIVQHRQMPTSAHLKDMSDRGATIKSQLHTIRAVAMRVPVSMLTELANDPNVAYITPDREIKMSATGPTNNEEFATAVTADIAASQYALNGTGIGVAVIDSGISDHPDLHTPAGNGPSRVVYNQSFASGGPNDQYGHGTHVAGLIGGNGFSSNAATHYATKFAGMAPNVNLINLRVLDQNGNGTDSLVIAAIQQAIALKNTYNIRVINMSLGRPIFESYTLDPVDQAVEAAWKAGIVVVVAAGNDGEDDSMGTDGFATIDVPGNDPSVITVGATLTLYTATRVDDTIASYSSKGPTLLDHIVKPDLVAPGNHQVSLLAGGSTLDNAYKSLEVAPSSGAARYFQLSGTSMATPVVSGAVALMLQQTPSLTPDQVKARLMETAYKGFTQYTQSTAAATAVAYANEYDAFTYGAGYLDTDAALGNTDLATGIALSPTAVFNSSDNTVTIGNTTPDSTFAGSSVVWGSKSVFATSVVWGAKAIEGTSEVWGATSVVWGAKSLTGFSVVWGAKDWISTSVGSLNSSALGDE